MGVSTLLINFALVIGKRTVDYVKEIINACQWDPSTQIRTALLSLLTEVTKHAYQDVHLQGSHTHSMPDYVQVATPLLHVFLADNGQHPVLLKPTLAYITTSYPKTCQRLYVP